MISQMDGKGLRNGAIAVVLLVAAIYLGSGRLSRFDPALIAYTSATIFATFGIVYRYSVWLQKPPTAMYWRRGWQLLRRPSRLLPNALHGIKLLVNNIALQRFIGYRDQKRWLAHFLMSWGCMVAVAVTFPLVFGWVHFEADPSDPSYYLAMILGVSAGRFPAYSLVGWVTFHILDFCAVAIIAGMAIAMKRRMSDKGAMSVQSFAMDFLPLIMLFAVCVTGLMLTVSAIWMHGHSYSFIALLHAFSVIITLIYLPFGKFFHIFQRPANLGVQFYKEEGRSGEQAVCVRCQTSFASLMHVEDLKVVMQQLGLDPQFEDGTHYQDVCPSCRRKMLAINQLEAIGGSGYL